MPAVKPSPSNAPSSVAALVALVAKLPRNQQYPSAAAMFAAAHPFTTKSIGQQGRQVLRNAQLNVGRGGRHGTTAARGTGKPIALTPAFYVGEYNAQQAAKGAQAQANKAAGAARGKAVRSGTATVSGARGAGHPPAKGSRASKAAQVRAAAQAPGNRKAAKVAS